MNAIRKQWKAAWRQARLNSQVDPEFRIYLNNLQGNLQDLAYICYYCRQA